MRRRALLAVGMACPAALPARAEWHPERPVRLVVPYVPGGSIDVMARLLGQALSGVLGKPVIVDNRPGASGIIGTEFVARSAPDGHTLLLGTANTHAANPALFRTLPYDPVRDFAPVSLLSSFPTLLVVHPSLPARDLDGLLALARERPGLTYGSPGSGTAQHLAGALLARRAGVELTAIPYRGAAPMIIDLVGGRLDMVLNPLVEVLPHVQAGRLRALGVTSAQRFQGLPGIPALAERLPGYDVTLWNALFAPAGTPAEAVARLGREVAAVLRTAEMGTKLAEQGGEAVGGTPEELARFLRAEMPARAELVRISGAVPE